MTTSERQRPSEQFGREAVKLWRTTGQTIEDLAHAIGKSKAQVERLQRGEGSMEVGILVRAQLAKRKVDMSSLPPLPGTDADGSDDDWASEWMWIGRVLREHAKPEWFSAEHAKLRKMAEALDVQARELAEIGKVR